MPPGYVTMPEATPRLLGVSRQTIMQRVKRGELSVVHVSCGKHKGLRIRADDNLNQIPYRTLDSRPPLPKLAPCAGNPC